MWRTNLHHHAILCQNRTYKITHFSIFKMAAVHNLFKFLVANQVETTNVHHHTNFTKIGQTVAEISRLTFIKMAAVHHLGFFKIWYFEQRIEYGRPIYVNMQNFIEIGGWDIAIYPFFQDDGRPPFWICGADCGTTHYENLVIFITVQNRISRFDNTKVWIFCAIGLKTPIHALFGCFGGKNMGNGNFLHCYPSRNAIIQNWRHMKQTA